MVIALDDESMEEESEVDDGERYLRELNELERIERLAQCEENLTQAIEKSLPFTTKTFKDARRQQVVPTPRSMDQVEEILAYARTLANRTSAPVGWNPNLPMVGFATPNPLPHQVRGGVLASMQLRMAKQEKEHGGETKTSPSKTKSAEKTSKEGGDKAKSDQRLDQRERQKRSAAEEARRRKRARDEEAPRQATMNLSDSSSSSDEDDDSDSS